MIESKAWNWKIDIHDYWKKASDEFLPVALRWKAGNLKKVLDLGCGIGRNTFYLANNNFNVYAFDLSESGLLQLAEEANKRNLNINIEKGDMLS